MTATPFSDPKNPDTRAEPDLMGGAEGEDDPILYEESPVAEDDTPAAASEAPVDNAMEQRLNKALYALAEAQNAQRRAQEEGQKQARFAITSFAKDMVSVADNLRRALDAVPADQREQDEGLDKLAQGVEMTERELLAALERHGVTRVEAIGQPFDPNRHRAVVEQEDPSVPHHTVVQEMQTGWLLHDRLLREAMVGVSRGGPKNSGDDNVDTSA